MRGSRNAAILAGFVTVGAATISSCGQDKPEQIGGSGGADTTTTSSSSDAASSSSSTGGSLPDVFTVTGIVTDGSAPVADAIVLQGGAEPAFVTGADGSFTIELSTALGGTPTVVASKIGYRTGGIEFVDPPEGPVEIVLRVVKPPDNVNGYSYGPPGVGIAEIDNSTAVCGHCHTTFVQQFNTSAHAKATRDPLVQDMYAGTSSVFTDAASCAAAGGIFRPGRLPGSEMEVVDRCYVGGGVLGDLNGCGGPNDISCDHPMLPDAEKPTKFGHCADCHAAGLDGATGGRNLLDATGIAFENGNHCDVCHKVSDIDLSKPPGTAGRLVIQRPLETLTGLPGSKIRQVMFGPLLDVPNEFMGGSYQPKFTESTFCAGCHEQKQEALLPGQTVNVSRFPDGLPTHSTYSEWSDSAWAAAGAACQHCHMPPNDGLFNTLDTMTPDNAGIVAGFTRPPEEIRSHAFPGPLAGPARLLDTALGMWLSVELAGGKISATVKLSNQGCGHGLPTGEPMRSLLLVVGAKACDKPLMATGGMTLDDVAGGLARGIIGQDITISANDWTWNAAAAIATPGNVVRVVRETGQWIDYPGIGYFADPMVSPVDKGMPEREPVGEAKVVAVAGNILTLDQSISVQPGDLVWLGEAADDEMVDGASSKALAGMSGQSFAKVLADASGQPMVPHYKAVDMVRDNRLPPFQSVTSRHDFALPVGCSNATVEATVVYRPVPLHFGKLRGWETRDWVAATRKESVTIP